MADACLHISTLHYYYLIHAETTFRKFLKYLERQKFQNPSGIRTYDFQIRSELIFLNILFVVTPLTHCATLFGDNFWKEIIFKIILDLIVYFDEQCVTT